MIIMGSVAKVSQNESVNMKKFGKNDKGWIAPTPHLRRLFSFLLFVLLFFCFCFFVFLFGLFCFVCCCCCCWVFFCLFVCFVLFWVFFFFFFFGFVFYHFFPLALMGENDGKTIPRSFQEKGRSFKSDGKHLRRVETTSSGYTGPSERI